MPARLPARTHLQPFAALLCILIVAAPAPAEAPFPIVQLTHNDYEDGFPCVSDGYIAWTGYPGSYAQVFLYDGFTTRQITDNPFSSNLGGISGTNIVWWGNDQVFWFDGTATTNLGDGVAPVISGHTIAWSNNKGTVFLYDGVSTRALGGGGSPDVSGSHVVWSGPGTNTTEILYYDGISTTQVTHNLRYDAFPKVSGDRIVWSGSDGHNWQVCYYDGTGISWLTSGSDANKYPRISETSIAWVSVEYHGGGVNGPSHVLFYDGVFAKELTKFGLDDYNLDICGDRVVWQGWDGRFFQVFLYEGKGICQLTDNEFSSYGPRISGDVVAWYGGPGAKEIFMTVIPEPGALSLLALGGLSLVRRRRH